MNAPPSHRWLAMFAAGALVSCAEPSRPAGDGLPSHAHDPPPITELDPPTYDVTRLGIGTSTHVDEDHAIIDFPAIFDGGWLVRTANGDRGADADSFITFVLEDSAFVAIAYDRRAERLPDWLGEWSRVDERLVTTNLGASPMRVRTRAIPPGPMVIGANLSAGGLGAESMYVLIIHRIGANHAALLEEVDVRLTPPAVSLSPGATTRFTAEVFDIFGMPSRSELFWSSSAGDLTQDGVYTAGPDAGVFSIVAATATGAADTSLATVAVDAVITTVRVSPSPVDLAPHETQQFVAEVFDEFGDPLSGEFAWSAEGGTISAEGLFVAGTVDGTFDVAATEGNSGVVGTASVSITTGPVLTEIEISPTRAELVQGESQLFTATTLDQFGSIGSFPVTWSTDGGQIDGDGLYLATTPGEFTVTASGAGVSGSADVIVTGTPDHDVAIDAGDDIQAAVDRHPPGTRFLLRAGVHLRQEVVPRDGNAFLGEPGAILDGDGVTQFAFRGGYGIDDVTIEGIEIRNYEPPVQWGAIRGVETLRWIVTDNEIHHCLGGVRLGVEMTVLRNHIHHNRQTGIMGQGDGALVAENEVAYNNFDLEFDPDDYPETFEAGGMKITHSEAVTIRDNFVHHNGVCGIWLDLDNRDIVIEGNRVEDNFHQGIFYEVSYDAVIRGNIVERNGFTGNWYHKAGIVIASSANVEVLDNFVTDNAQGIIGSQVERGDGDFGPHWLQNLNVHHNTVTQREGVIGVVRDDSVGDEVFEGRNNRFEDNVYYLGTNPRYFRWEQTDLTESGWIDAGHDSGGEFNRADERTALTRTRTTLRARANR